MLKAKDKKYRAQVPGLCKDFSPVYPSVASVASGLFGSPSLLTGPRLDRGCHCLMMPIWGPNNLQMQCHCAKQLKCFVSQIHNVSPGRQKDHKGNKQMRAPSNPRAAVLKKDYIYLPGMHPILNNRMNISFSPFRVFIF
jgi:hypothetical protein